MLAHLILRLAMTRVILKYTARLVKILGLPIALIGVFLLSNSPVVVAAGETYSFISGDRIQATGGLYGNGVFNFTKSVGIPGTPTRYIGEPELITNTTTGTTCRVALNITESSGNYTLSQPPGGTPPITSSPGVTVTPSCDPDNQTLINNLTSNISVANSPSSPGQGDQASETAGQRAITVTVHSDRPTNNIPETSVKLSSSRQNFAPQSINYNSSSSSGSTTFNDRDAGRYTVCVGPASVIAPGGPSYSTQSGEACRTVSKLSGRALSVEFGDSNQAYNPNGKAVGVNVRINIPGHANAKTYGPVDIRISKSSDDSTVDISATDSRTIGESGTNTPAQPITISSRFDDIEPGDYRACIVDTQLCSSFSKVANRAVNVEINVPESESENLVGSEEEGGTSCNIDGLGWILCPVVNVIGNITDASYSVVETMLMSSPRMFDRSDAQGGGATYGAWVIMRNIANVAFVIAFLVIIYSQLTGMGVNNYGVKRMLPRLIIAAILVNLSFIVCAIAVDVANIAGSSLKEAIDRVTDSVVPAEGSYWSQGVGNMWVDIIIPGVIAASVLAWTSFAVLLPILISALAAIVTVVVVLALRQALIILLVVISPLAFIAFLLPNTEGLFKKWRSLFVTLLVMFPAVALIFGASSLAGKIVMNTADGNTIIQIVGAGITIIPLFITPVIMKTAGGVLNRFAGVVNNKDRGVFDRMRKSAEGYKGYRRNVNQTKRLGRTSNILGKEGGVLGGKNTRRRKMAAFLGGSGSVYSVNRSQKQGYAEAEAKEGAQEYFAKRALADEKFAKHIGGGKATALQASAQAAVDKLEAESVSNREVLLRAKIDPHNITEVSEALKKAIEGNDVADARAAQSILLKSGSKGIEELSKTIAENESSLGVETSRALRKDINGAGLKGKDNALASWAYTDDRLSNLINKEATYAELNPTELAGQPVDRLMAAERIGAITPEMAKATLSNPQADSILGKTKKDILVRIAEGHTPPTPAGSEGATLSIPRSSTSSSSTSAGGSGHHTPLSEGDFRDH